MFTPSEKKYLLAVARRALQQEICGESAQTLPTPIESEALTQRAGAFVTLMDGHELRGCLGLLSSDAPLTVTIAEMARRAATEDPRFDPVSKREAERLTIEISVLSPFTRITRPEEIVIGRDGLLIQLGRRRGLLLPQVGERYNFSSVEFLEETCLKAGLPREAWTLEEAELYSFTAEVICEEEAAAGNAAAGEKEVAGEELE
jgi:AmmeMemoRadiSam system protein A